ALAVFPLLSWEMTIAIGRSLRVSVTYDNLLRLARIPALQKDTFDERLRQELLRELDPQAERKARQTVQTELAAVKAIAQGSHVQRELETALAIQHFALNPQAPENQDTIRFLLRTGILSKGQEAELDKVTTRYAGAEMQKLQRRTKGGPGRVPTLKVRDYLAQQHTDTVDDTPEPRLEHGRPDLLKAIATTAAYLILLLIGWQLGGSEALYQLAFGQKPEQRLIQRADEPLRDYLLVKETFVIDSAVLLNNKAVDAYEQGAVNEAEELLQRASRAGGLYPGPDGLLESYYKLAGANFARLQYNRAVNLLELYLKDSISQQELARRFEGVNVKLSAIQSDTLTEEIDHARGVINYYLGQPDSLLEHIYKRLDSTGFFDRIDYRPNLETLLQRERSRIRDLNIREFKGRDLLIQVDYYYNAERDGADLEIVAYTEGEGRQPEAAATAASLGPGSARLRLRPNQRTTGTATHVIVELRRGEKVVNRVRTAYTHPWQEPVRESTHRPAPEGNQKTTDNVEQ
ncbi:MAG: tetratricopeptide repeat protein, partial [Bacteroidetes bacterium]